MCYNSLISYMLFSFKNISFTSNLFFHSLYILATYIYQLFYCTILMQHCKFSLPLTKIFYKGIGLTHMSRYSPTQTYTRIITVVKLWLLLEYWSTKKKKKKLAALKQPIQFRKKKLILASPPLSAYVTLTDKDRVTDRSSLSTIQNVHRVLANSDHFDWRKVPWFQNFGWSGAHNSSPQYGNRVWI